MSKTKNGKERTGNKANITEHRLFLRTLMWEPLRDRLRYHLALSPHGEASTIARTLGIAKSQIHRFACDECNHDQEPSFSIGAALALYLGHAKTSPIINIPKPKRKKGKH